MDSASLHNLSSGNGVLHNRCLEIPVSCSTHKAHLAGTPIFVFQPETMSRVHLMPETSVRCLAAAVSPPSFAIAFLIISSFMLVLCIRYDKNSSIPLYFIRVNNSFLSLEYLSVIKSSFHG